MKPKKQKLKTKLRTTCYNKLPTQVSQREFNQFIKPFLRKPHHGPKPKISYYKIFNYIMYVLHSGMQWKNLKPCRGEISWQTVYHHHNRWCKDGSYQSLFESSVEVLDKLGKLDLTILHGDGSNVVAKKGARKSDTTDGNIRKVKKSLK
jgi:transposase